MINKRVELADFEKAQKRLENRLNNFIMQVYEKEGIAAEQDAIIAKQPWFCLSCDNELKDYTCKLAKNVGLEKATGKKVNRELHMVRRNENGRLPSVYK